MVSNWTKDVQERNVIGLRWDIVFQGRLAMSVDLFGSFTCTIENGRIKLPASFCKSLSIESKQPFHITKENTDCLFLYSQAQWEKRAEELMKLEIREKGDISLRRIADMHYTIDVDKNGRLTIPPDLRKAAELDKKVIVVGLFKRMEIWNVHKYERSLERM